MPPACPFWTPDWMFLPPSVAPPNAVDDKANAPIVTTRATTSDLALRLPIALYRSPSCDCFRPPAAPLPPSGAYGPTWFWRGRVITDALISPTGMPIQTRQDWIRLCIGNAA